MTVGPLNGRSIDDQLTNDRHRSMHVGDPWPVGWAGRASSRSTSRCRRRRRRRGRRAASRRRARRRAGPSRRRARRPATSACRRRCRRRRRGAAASGDGSRAAAGGRRTGATPARSRTCGAGAAAGWGCRVASGSAAGVEGRVKGWGRVEISNVRRFFRLFFITLWSSNIWH